MKKQLFFAVLCSLMLISCSQNEPKQAKQVSFNVSSFSITQQSMNAPRRAPILDDQDGTALTDLYVFDGTTMLVHQTSDLEAFGCVTLTLEYGSHDLSFIATRSIGQSYSAGVLSVTGVRPTFGKLQSITISDATDAFDIVLNRVTGQLIINIEDAIPADADYIKFQIAQKYDNLLVASLNGTGVYTFEQTASLTSSVGITGKSFTINMLSPTYQTQYTTDVTLSVYRSDDSVIAQHIIHDVPVCSNTKTILSGEMFGGSSFTITANHSWEDHINVW